MSLALLGSSQGFTAGDLSTAGYTAMVPAYQKVYFADGRTKVAGGFHKLDFISTRLYGTPSGAFIPGESLTQVTSGAAGIFIETVTTKHYVYRTTTVEFDTSHQITGGTSGKTLTPSAILAPPHWLTWVEETGYEGLPDGGANIGTLCFGRIFINDMWHPNQWYACRMGGTQPEDADHVIESTRDWLVGQADIGSPVSSQSSKAGLVGDAITAMISYQDDFLIFGCANSVWVLRGDPGAGGILTRLTDSTGIFSQSAWCWDDKNNLYFVGTDGIYSLSSNAIINSQPPSNLTKAKIPQLITGMKLNRRTDTVCLGFDRDRYGIQFSATLNDGTWNDSFWLSLITGGVFPLSFYAGQVPMCMSYFNSYQSESRGLLMGDADGYIRIFDPTAKSDDGTHTISSFAHIGPVLTPDDITKEPNLHSVDLSLGSDSDPVTVNIYSTCYTAERLVKGILDGSEYPRSTKVFSTSARHPVMQQNTRRKAIAFKLGNSTVDKSWYIENYNIKAEGK